MILYEHPFNERIRYMIRLEYLFQQLFLFSQKTSPEAQHIAFSLLFQIIDVCDRGDSRHWVLQEIDKQKISLESYRQFPNIDEEALNTKIKQLDKVSADLLAARKPGAHIKECEWLFSLKNKFLSPGTTSSTDCPSYAAWLHGHETNRLQVIQELIEPFMPLYQAIDQSLSIIREAAIPDMESSRSNGIYEKNIGGKVYQLVRIWLPEKERIYPEISANKHVIMIRFFRMNERFKQKLITEPIGFKMALCQI